MSKHKQIALALALMLVLSIWSTSAQGLGFEPFGKYDATRHSRFMLGTFPETPVPNDAFFLAQYEDQLRGVGWQTSRPKKKVALISPQHFLTATHFKATGSITFLDDSGNLQTFVVSNITKVYEDISIGKLKTPVPDELGILPFPVASVNWNGPRGREVFYVGDSPPGTISTFAIGRTGFYKSREGKVEFHRSLVSSEYAKDRVHGIVGDSGSPSFFIESGELILLGHHYTAYQDYILSLQAKAVNNQMSDTDYSLDLRELPSGCGSGAVQGAFMTLVIVGWHQNHRKRT